MTKEFLQDRRTSFEEIFFAKQDAKVIAALREERELLRGANELRAQLESVEQALFAGDDAALDRVKAAERTLERWSARSARRW